LSPKSSVLGDSCRYHDTHGLRASAWLFSLRRDVIIPAGITMTLVLAMYGCIVIYRGNYTCSLNLANIYKTATWCIYCHGVNLSIDSISNIGSRSPALPKCTSIRLTPWLRYLTIPVIFLNAPPPSVFASTSIYFRDTYAVYNIALLMCEHWTYALTYLLGYPEGIHCTLRVMFHDSA
jgi:hypothetical protein